MGKAHDLTREAVAPATDRSLVRQPSSRTGHTETKNSHDRHEQAWDPFRFGQPPDSVKVECLGVSDGISRFQSSSLGRGWR